MSTLSKRRSRRTRRTRRLRLSVIAAVAALAVVAVGCVAAPGAKFGSKDVRTTQTTCIVFAEKGYTGAYTDLWGGRKAVYLSPDGHGAFRIPKDFLVKKTFRRSKGEKIWRTRFGKTPGYFDQAGYVDTNQPPDYRMYPASRDHKC